MTKLSELVEQDASGPKNGDESEQIQEEVEIMEGE